MLKGLKILKLPSGKVRVTPQYFTKGGGTYTAWPLSETSEVLADAVKAVMQSEGTQLVLRGLG